MHSPSVACGDSSLEGASGCSRLFSLLKTVLQNTTLKRTAFFNEIYTIMSKKVITMAENKLADMSTEFTVEILNLTDGIKGHYSLTK